MKHLIEGLTEAAYFVGETFLFLGALIIIVGLALLLGNSDEGKDPPMYGS